MRIRENILVIANQNNNSNETKVTLVEMPYTTYAPNKSSIESYENMNRLLNQVNNQQNMNTKFISPFLAQETTPNTLTHTEPPNFIRNKRKYFRKHRNKNSHM